MKIMHSKMRRCSMTFTVVTFLLRGKLNLDGIMGIRRGVKLCNDHINVLKIENRFTIHRNNIGTLKPMAKRARLPPISCWEK
jgi:hypothetical protein